MYFFRYLVDEVIEVVNLHVIATLGRATSPAVLSELLEHLRLLHKFICEPMKVLSPNFDPILSLPVLLLQTKDT